MKKIILCISAFFFLLNAWAYDFKVGGIFYNILADKTNEVEVTNHRGIGPSYSGSVTIPETVTVEGNTYNVTSIGDGAFSGCSGLTSVTIGNCVTSIGHNAFSGCSGLTSVTIGNGVTSIGDGAFYGCSGLTSITIPNSVTSIGYGAFDGCSGLTSITIPNSVTSIGYGAFFGCSSLTEIVVEEGNIMYDSRENCNAIIETASNTLIAGCRNTTILNGVTSIRSAAFYGCSGLTSISIPNSVESIGDQAFYDCSGLTSMTIGNGVTSIGDDAFSSCSSLKSVTIPNSVKSIGDGAFAGCSGLTSINIPNSVDSIGESAFLIYRCPLLDTVIAPASIYDCPETTWAGAPKNISYVEVNAGELTADAFGFINRSYKTLKVLNLAAATNTDIADEAFKGCYNLESLYLPSQLEYIPYMAVADCKLLQSITIPASVEEIANSAFENCRSLKSVIFEGTKTPNGMAQYAAASGSALKRIGSWAFYNCHQLEHLTIPEGVTEVGDAAFYGCTYLADMTLPSTVQEIGDNGFALCAKLQEIHVKAMTPPVIKPKTFFDVNRRIPVYVPADAVEAYESDPYWGEFDIQAEEAPSALPNSSIAPSANTRKLMRNGQLIIIRDGKTYNAMGVEM